MRVAGGITGDLSCPPSWKNSSETFDEADPRTPAPATAVGRKKTAVMGVRAWLAVNSTGEARMVEAGKQAIMRRTGLPARDLRILDPQLSYPSTILGRERAIVINLEHIKAVITAHEILILNSTDPTVSPFVHQLQRRLTLRQVRQMEGDGGGSGDGSHSYDLQEIRTSRSPPENSGNLDYSEEDDDLSEMVQKGKLKEAGDFSNSNGPKVLPFEFIALEACLEAACSCLEIEAKTLEKEAYPALDKLTSKISTLNLEHVRQIKSRLVAITGRVQKVRDELEHLLDDDEDMAEMYLTNKLLQQQQSNGSPQSSQMDQSSSFNGARIPAETSSDENDIEYHSNYVISGSSLVFGDGHESHTFSTRTSFKHLDVEELEMLLEAYFVQIDSTLNKLSTLREYVDDTEDYINIMLDDKQNHLLQMGVVLTTATLIVSAFVVLVAIFGMNIKVDLFDENKAGTTEFVWTVGGGAAGSLLLYVVAVSWCKHKGILD
ncbi:magnesium transporter MRS2-3 isoform X1 [Dendrobium catenatum]|uniref:Magnesium transporter n=1 Tax=Dendrobium catenatum TaxID=906689 RepID=A0A2I0VSJ5_9ASPA|nr:magnesium transporter MRS2-3 isoform X1 [Dendrobium catenatum]PKU66384.1 Magnesium transporter MRS2-3 [Dendrobium catenatum]